MITKYEHIPKWGGFNARVTHISRVQVFLTKLVVLRFSGCQVFHSSSPFTIYRNIWTRWNWTESRNPHTKRQVECQEMSPPPSRRKTGRGGAPLATLVLLVSSDKSVLLATFAVQAVDTGHAGLRRINATPPPTLTTFSPELFALSVLNNKNAFEQLKDFVRSRHTLIFAHSTFIRLHFQPLGSTPTTLSQTERGTSHVT